MYSGVVQQEAHLCLPQASGTSDSKALAQPTELLAFVRVVDHQMFARHVVEKRHRVAADWVLIILVQTVSEHDATTISQDVSVVHLILVPTDNLERHAVRKPGLDPLIHVLLEFADILILIATVVLDA